MVLFRWFLGRLRWRGGADYWRWPCGLSHGHGRLGRDRRMCGSSLEAGLGDVVAEEEAMFIEIR
jgi:hypothetical protein